MSHKPSKVVLVLALLMMLIAMSAPAYPAANATIMEDRVDIREQPSVNGRSFAYFNNGNRVEVIGKTDFSDTIDGYTAPWYQLSLRSGGGFVFGRDLKIDRGVTVPPLQNMICEFVAAGLSTVGDSEYRAKKNLGEPVSRTDENFEPAVYDGCAYIIANHKLVYNDIEIEFDVRDDDSTHVRRISFTTGFYEFWGLRVGSSETDVRRVLGDPNEVKGDILYYHDPNLITFAAFTIQNGTVVEVSFHTECQG